MQDMTGLSMDVKEPLNLYHYGVGGPFWDQKIKTHKMAMILFYVSDYIFKGVSSNVGHFDRVKFNLPLGLTESVFIIELYVPNYDRI